MRFGSSTLAQTGGWSLVVVLSVAAHPVRLGSSDLDAALEAWRAEHGSSWELDVDQKIGFGELLYGGGAAPTSKPQDELGFVRIALDVPAVYQDPDGTIVELREIRESVGNLVQVGE